MEHFFSPNLVEDKKKKGLHQKETFFSRIQVDTYAQMYTRVKLLGGLHMHSILKLLGGYSQIIGGMYPSSPRVSAPLAMKIVELITITYHKVGIDI